MAKIKVIEHIHEGEKFHPNQYMYFCKGCGKTHVFGLKAEGGHHNFNMDLEVPTVTPSLVQNFTPGQMCHSYINAGKIEYLSDCYHELKGQTIELPDIDKMIEIGEVKV